MSVKQVVSLGLVGGVCVAVIAGWEYVRCILLISVQKLSMVLLHIAFRWLIP